MADTYINSAFFNSFKAILLLTFFLVIAFLLSKAGIAFNPEKATLSFLIIAGLFFR